MTRELAPPKVDEWTASHPDGWEHIIAGRDAKVLLMMDGEPRSMHWLVQRLEKEGWLETTITKDCNKFWRLGMLETNMVKGKRWWRVSAHAAKLLRLQATVKRMNDVANEVKQTRLAATRLAAEDENFKDPPAAAAELVEALGTTTREHLLVVVSGLVAVLEDWIEE